MLAQNYTFFYIISAFLVTKALFIIFLPKFSQFITAAALFFVGTGVLYLGFNSVFIGITQLFVIALGVILLLITGYKALNASNGEKYLFNSKKFLAGACSVILIFIVPGLFIYYFFKVPYDREILFTDSENTISLFASFFITLKTIFKEYFLAYFLIMAAYAAILVGVYILIAKNRDKKLRERSKE